MHRKRSPDEKMPPPPPWETGRPATVSLDVLPEWLRSHRARVVRAYTRTVRGEWKIILVVVPGGKTGGKKP